MKKHTQEANWLEGTQMNRRNFLSLCAVGSLPILLGACQSQPGVNATTTPRAATATPRATSTPTPTRPPVLSETDWSNLGKSLQGTLVRPNNPQYATAHQLFDPQFDGIKPAGVAYCASPKDVQNCLSFVSRFNLPVTARSGGHSYAGYSTTSGLLLDVSRMNAITIDSGSGNATIGSGAKLIDVYAALAQKGRVIPAGSCPTVGVAGLTLGGGVGVLGRKFGLTCDNLLSAQVVLADGRIVTCDASQNSDLFWALRGGGGGNFGVVTSFTFQTHPVDALAIFTLGWNWSDAAAVVNAWQNWAPQAPDELWSNCLLLNTVDKSGTPRVLVNGVYVGGVDALNQQLQNLINKLGIAPITRYASNSGLLDTMLYEAGCSNKTVSQCRLPSQDPQGQIQRDSFAAKSDYIAKPLSTQAINSLVNAITQYQQSSTPGTGGIGMDAYGGAINRVAPNATAFAHRTMLFSIQYNANWDVGASDTVIAQNRSWLNSTWQNMRGYASGAAYQNYIDPSLSNWQQAYYGTNLARLQQVKTTYDPKNLFRFKQSIPLPH
ncbi:FAD-binding oxidoreductase [Dictyobacter aurantiacus]|uniref:FAD-binding dehydrogenase n=1 Tax=Dictyobacter aurantiacus TaxID=1936993 RepID=A0A401ZS62_9CHLR|nr:FAD-binding oxidoreductase [Dictyobacter aurantiacus]GCE09705.1 FAD-binding dehydrogenase [Dictyobacter aurantiacus]